MAKTEGGMQLWLAYFYLGPLPSCCCVVCKKVCAQLSFLKSLGMVPYDL